MTLHVARPADLEALDDFLLARAEGAMFALANLRDHGLVPSNNRHATRFWIARTATGAVAGAVGLTGEGMVLPQWPRARWPALRPVLAGAAVSGAIGPAGQVRAALAALGLAGAQRRTDADEPGFALDLARLQVPEGAGDLRPVSAADAAIVIGWRAAYLAEVFAAPPGEAAETAARDVAAWLERDTHRLLWQGDTPVALAGLNAVLPEIVQVGGVWTPPALRGRGLARRTVGLLLAEARARGVTRAVLFAASAAAARAYVSLGFRPVDPVTVILFAGVQEVPRWR